MIHTLQRLRAQKIKNGEGGFTLIELLIVIVVLGILAAVVVFSLGGVTAQADQSACTADFATINTAVVAFNAANSTSQSPQTPTITLLDTGGNAFLQTWPTSGKFAFSLVKGVIYFEGTNVTTATAYNMPGSATGQGTAGANDCMGKTGTTAKPTGNLVS